jgi:hypothetical protein
MFFEGIRSERQLVEIANLNLAHRWYFGSTPDRDAHTRTELLTAIPVLSPALFSDPAGLHYEISGPTVTPAPCVVAVLPYRNEVRPQVLGWAAGRWPS